LFYENGDFNSAYELAASEYGLNRDKIASCYLDAIKLADTQWA